MYYIHAQQSFSSPDKILNMIGNLITPRGDRQAIKASIPGKSDIRKEGNLDARILGGKFKNTY